jgi:hypothetical protein
VAEEGEAQVGVVSDAIQPVFGVLSGLRDRLDKGAGTLPMLTALRRTLVDVGDQAG